MSAGGATISGVINGNASWVNAANIQSSTGQVSGQSIVAIGSNSTGMQDVGFSMVTWPTTASAANAQVANSNVIRLVTSLRASKHDIVPIALVDAKRTVLGLQSVLYQSNVDDDQRQWPGLIAEDVERVNPLLAVYRTDGALQSVAYDRVPAFLLPVVQDHEARLAALEAARKPSSPRSRIRPGSTSRR